MTNEKAIDIKIDLDFQGDDLINYKLESLKKKLTEVKMLIDEINAIELTVKVKVC